MTDNIYFTTIIKKTIIIEANKLRQNIHDEILKIIKNDYEGKCIEEGFVKPGSSTITKRSLLKMVPNNFKADMSCDVRIKTDICRPVKGNVIECKVEKINKMGLMATEGPLSIAIPRSFHTNKDAFKDIEIDQRIKIEVIGTRYEINWDHIDVIAKLHIPGKKSKKTEIKIIETPGPQVDVLEEMSDVNSDIETLDDDDEDNEPILDEDNETNQEDDGDDNESIIDDEDEDEDDMDEMTGGDEDLDIDDSDPDDSDPDDSDYGDDDEDEDL